MTKLEEALRCFGSIKPVGDPVRCMAFRISGIENSKQDEFVRRSLGILCAIGSIDPTIKRTHYKQFSAKDLDDCPPDAMAAVCLRIMHEKTMALFGISIEDFAEELASIERRKS